MTQKRAVLDQLNIVVGDMAAALDFYRTLGIEFEESPAPWASHHRKLEVDGELDVDLDSATFAKQWDSGWPAGKSGVVVGFRVTSREDVDALYAELTGAGNVGHQPPYDAFWGARYAIVLDPSGNAVGLMSPVDPERRTRPPEPGAS
jgi:uncharacterized glyoxalase superfamily protein PhnB